MSSTINDPSLAETSVGASAETLAKDSDPKAKPRSGTKRHRGSTEETQESDLQTSMQQASTRRASKRIALRRTDAKKGADEESPKVKEETPKAKRSKIHSSSDSLRGAQSDAGADSGSEAHSNSNASVSLAAGSSSVTSASLAAGSSLNASANFSVVPMDSSADDDTTEKKEGKETKEKKPSKENTQKAKPKKSSKKGKVSEKDMDVDSALPAVPKIKFDLARLPIKQQKKSLIMFLKTKNTSEWMQDFKQAFLSAGDGKANPQRIRQMLFASNQSNMSEHGLNDTLILYHVILNEKWDILNALIEFITKKNSASQKSEKGKKKSKPTPSKMTKADYYTVTLCALLASKMPFKKIRAFLNQTKTDVNREFPLHFYGGEDKPFDNPIAILFRQKLTDRFEKAKILAQFNADASLELFHSALKWDAEKISADSYNVNGQWRNIRQFWDALFKFRGADQFKSGLLNKAFELRCSKETLLCLERHGCTLDKGKMSKHELACFYAFYGLHEEYIQLTKELNQESKEYLDTWPLREWNPLIMILDSPYLGMDSLQIIGFIIQYQLKFLEGNNQAALLRFVDKLIPDSNKGYTYTSNPATWTKEEQETLMKTLKIFRDAALPLNYDEFNKLIGIILQKAIAKATDSSKAFILEVFWAVNNFQAKEEDIVEYCCNAYYHPACVYDRRDYHVLFESFVKNGYNAAKLLYFAHEKDLKIDRVNYADFELLNFTKRLLSMEFDFRFKPENKTSLLMLVILSYINNRKHTAKDKIESLAFNIFKAFVEGGADPTLASGTHPFYVGTKSPLEIMVENSEYVTTRGKIYPFQKHFEYLKRHKQYKEATSLALKKYADALKESVAKAEEAKAKEEGAKTMQANPGSGSASASAVSGNLPPVASLSQIPLTSNTQTKDAISPSTVFINYFSEPKRFDLRLILAEKLLRNHPQTDADFNKLMDSMKEKVKRRIEKLYKSAYPLKKDASKEEQELYEFQCSCMSLFHPDKDYVLHSSTEFFWHSSTFQTYRYLMRALFGLEDDDDKNVAHFGLKMRELLILTIQFISTLSQTSEKRKSNFTKLKQELKELQLSYHVRTLSAEEHQKRLFELLCSLLSSYFDFIPAAERTFSEAEIEANVIAFINSKFMAMSTEKKDAIVAKIDPTSGGSSTPKLLPQVFINEIMTEYTTYYQSLIKWQFLSLDVIKHCLKVPEITRFSVIATHAMYYNAKRRENDLVLSFLWDDNAYEKVKPQKAEAPGFASLGSGSQESGSRSIEPLPAELQYTPFGFLGDSSAAVPIGLLGDLSAAIGASSSLQLDERDESQDSKGKANERVRFL